MGGMTQRQTDDRLVSFVAEYRALCERHGLVVGYDGGFMASEVYDLADVLGDEENPDWDWELMRYGR